MTDYSTVSLVQPISAIDVCRAWYNVLITGPLKREIAVYTAATRATVE